MLTLTAIQGKTLTEFCQRAKNWFDLKSDHTPYGHYSGTITITTNAETHKSTISINGNVMEIPTNHFRLIDSLKNNGVHSVDDELAPEIFDGAVWLMVIPDGVIDLVENVVQSAIDNGKIIKSPFTSESHKGYTYNLGSANNGTRPSIWDLYDSDITPWRKI